jgi:hypothetical protein
MIKYRGRALKTKQAQELYVEMSREKSENLALRLAYLKAMDAEYIHTDKAGDVYSWRGYGLGRADGGLTVCQWRPSVTLPSQDWSIYFAGLVEEMPIRHGYQLDDDAATGVGTAREHFRMVTMRMHRRIAG